MESTEVKTPDIKTITSAGQPERHDFSNQKPPVAAPENNGAAPAAAADAAATNGAAAAATAATEVKPPELNDEQLKQLLEGMGIKGVENFASLKEKIEKADKPADIAPTEEEKKAAEAAMDKKMLDRYIETGGTAEAYVALKQIAAMDLRELSVAELKTWLKEKKFTDEEIEGVVKERYYQLNPDELKKNRTYDDDNGWVEESDEDFNKRKELLKKKVAAFSPKLDSRGIYTKQKAEGVLNTLRESIKADELAVAKEAQFSSMVDEFSKKLPREVTFELGEINKIKQDPVVFKVSDADIAEVVETFKDPAKRQQFLFNEDKTLNHANLIELKLRNKYLESALKAAYIEGGNRQVAALEKVFPGTAKALGVGGSQQAATQGRKGVIASAGAPEVAVPQHR